MRVGSIGQGGRGACDADGDTTEEVADTDSEAAPENGEAWELAMNRVVVRPRPDRWEGVLDVSMLDLMRKRQSSIDATGRWEVCERDAEPHSPV